MIDYSHLAINELKELLAIFVEAQDWKEVTFIQYEIEGRKIQGTDTELSPAFIGQINKMVIDFWAAQPVEYYYEILKRLYNE